MEKQTERQKLEKEFHEMFEERKKLFRKRDRLDRECEKNETYTSEKYDEHSKTLKAIMDINKELDKNVDERTAKGYIIIEF